jgi:tRNA G18 (ribose-2'-O)-methylase SpoU
MTGPEHASDLLQDFADLRGSDAPGRRSVILLEGATLVGRALDRGLVPRAVLCARGRHAQVLERIPAGVPVYIRSAAEIETLCGYAFHRGLLASADRPALPADPVIPGPGSGPLLVLPEINDPENLGSLLRTAAAFGVCGVLLGERCQTPFTRRVLRVSMGAALELPLAHSSDLAAGLARLRDQGVQLLASSARRGITPAELARCLPPGGPAPPRALLLGNEGHGLDPALGDLCHTWLRIPLGPAVSSLNVALAAGILLYELCGRGTEPRHPMD